jgi:hypothetical protein
MKLQQLQKSSITGTLHCQMQTKQYTWNFIICLHMTKDEDIYLNYAFHNILHSMEPY